MADEILYEEKRRLPVLATVKESYRYIRRNFDLLAVPTLLLCLAEWAISYLSIQNTSRSTFWQGLAPFWPIIGSLIDISFIVGLHRAIILGEVRGGPAFFRFDRYLFRYAIATILFSLVLLATAITVVGLSRNLLADLRSMPAWQFLALGVVALPVLYLMVRVTLAFAAAAVGARHIFRLSWRATSGTDTLRLFAVIALVLMPLIVLAAVLFTPLFVAAGLNGANIAATADSLPFIGIDGVLETAITVVMTVAVSLSYQKLVPPQPVEPALPSL